MTACLPAAGAAWRPSAAELEGRRDLREGRALVASIDPPGCVDIDDALHCHEVAPGTWGANPHPHPQANPHPHPHPHPNPKPNPNPSPNPSLHGGVERRVVDDPLDALVRGA